jgi:hypothetical protein
MTFVLFSNLLLEKKRISYGKKLRNRKSIMSASEVITITVLFHLSGIGTFKLFYVSYVQVYLKKEFPNTVSYNRFVELMQANVMALSLYMKTCCWGECTRISYVDSTPLRACKNKRISQNKVFKNIATIGKSTMGWFYGFKLHIIVNDNYLISSSLRLM